VCVCTHAGACVGVRATPGVALDLFINIPRETRRLYDGVALRPLQVVLPECLGADGPRPGRSHDQHLRAGDEGAESVAESQP
jgi:hypothetical protein